MHEASRSEFTAAATRPARRWSAASSLALILLVACGDTVEPSPAPTPEGGFVLQSPVGSVDGYHEFVWDYDLPMGGTFQVAVYDYTSGAPLGPLRRSTKLELPQWIPREGPARGFPDRILWRVFAYDREGELLGSAEAEASRR